MLKCAECGEPLVESLRSKQYSDDIDFVCMLSTFNATDVAMVESLLDGSNIDYYVLGENFMYARPLLEPVRVMVVKEQAEEALELLKDLNLTIRAIKIDGRNDKGTDG